MEELNTGRMGSTKASMLFQDLLKVVENTEHVAYLYPLSSLGHRHLALGCRQVSIIILNPKTLDWHKHFSYNIKFSLHTNTTTTLLTQELAGESSHLACRRPRLPKQI